MSKNYLEMLETAYLECQSLDSPQAIADYVTDLEQVDRNLARELSSLLALRDEDSGVLDVSCGQFCSIMFTTLGEAKKTETRDDLINFLGQLSPSKSSQGIANLSGIELQELVGTGATGFVFKGWDTELCRPVAVKVLAPSIAKDPTMRQTFAAEARLATSVRHKNVVSIYHTFSDPTSALAYFVMEWVEGFTLQQWLDQRTEPQTDSLEANWVEQLVHAVAAIHRKEIVHRDLKPANILIETDSNNLILIDFGLAFEKVDLRQSQYPKGTPLYMSPEQLQGGCVTRQSDLFSLAEIVCLLLYGVHPFMDTQIDMLTQKILIEEPTLPLGEEHPIRPVFKKAFSKDFRDRYENAEAFQEDLQQAILAGQPLQGASKSVLAAQTKPTFIRPKQMLLALAVVLVLFAVPLTWGWYGRPVAQAVGENTENGPDAPLKNSQANETHDFGVGEGPFKNYLGMTMLPFEIDPVKMSAWPGDKKHEGLFKKLNWQNRGLEAFYLSRNLVTISQYRSVMKDLPEVNQGKDPAGPVVGVSFEQVNEFCRRMTNEDPHGLQYRSVNAHNFHFAMYGNAYLNERKSIDTIVKDFRESCQDGRSPRRVTFPLQDVFAGIKEWTGHDIRFPSASEGVISYIPGSFFPQDIIYEVVGGYSGELFLHLHDMQFGMNDFYQDSHGLKLFEETDGDTSYLCPEKGGQESWLNYRYQFESPIVTAKISDPFWLAEDQSSAGIRVRGLSANEQGSLQDKAWQSVFRVKGQHRQSQPLEVWDLTEYLQGCVEVEVQYWIKAERVAGVGLNYTQMGRTQASHKVGASSQSHAYPECFRFEAVTEQPVQDLRGFTPVPGSYKSPRISFRVEAAKKLERPKR